MRSTTNLRRRRRPIASTLPQRHEVAGVLLGTLVAYCAARGGFALLGDALAALHRALGR